MNKEDFAQLHYLLAKLKYELKMISFECHTEDYKKDLDEQIKAIDLIQKVFIVEGE